MKHLPTLALVDDHVLIRKGIASLLVEKEYPVMLQADNGQHFIQQLQKTGDPDVVLLDINMPVMDGYATAQWLKENRPDVRVLALSVLDDENTIIRMLHSGARGYILKDSEPEELTLAINTIAERGFYQSELVSSKVIHKLQHDGDGSALPKHLLTGKEILFLQLNCSEMTYKEIAAEMHLSPRTIDGYRDILFEKLGIRSRVGLVLFAIRHRIVQV